MANRMMGHNVVYSYTRCLLRVLDWPKSQCCLSPVVLVVVLVSKRRWYEFEMKMVVNSVCT